MDERKSKELPESPEDLAELLHHAGRYREFVEGTDDLVTQVGPDGNIIGTRGTARDISERKKTENALKESEAKYRAYVDRSPVAVFVTDAQMRYKDVNAAAAVLTGYSVDELLARSIKDLVPPEIFEKNPSQFARMISEGAVSIETQLMRKNGGKVDVALEAARLGDDRFIAFCVDIGDRRRAEIKERELLDRLANARRMEALGVLAGGVAHDLNNVLGPLVALPDLVLDDLQAAGCFDKEFEKDMVEALEVLSLSGRRATATIRDLTVLGRRGRSRKNELYLSALVTDLVRGADVRELVRSRPEVSLSCDLTSVLEPVVGSHDPLIRRRTAVTPWGCLSRRTARAVVRPSTCWSST